jgi:GNAT superfamily N-acetyltransferase
MHIRGATAADAVALAGLLSELGYPSAPTVLPERLRRLEEEGSTVLVAVSADQSPVGLACLTMLVTLHADPPVAYITALVTAEHARGHGVGRALLAAAEAWARGRGCTRLTVTSAEHRADAHAFYSRCGLPYSGRRFTRIIAEVES